MKKSESILLVSIGLIALVISGINPYDRMIWFMEIFPVIVGIPVLFAVHPRFRFTPLAYRLVFLHCIILMVGGHYTYARVPLGLWAQDIFELSRNHYDRVGHLAQGFIPAILIREVLLRQSPLKIGKWLFFLTTSVCLAISACYEFIEWWAALIGGERADSFLGTQGDVWDTQWDMFLALIGAIIAQLLFSRMHDRQIEQMGTVRLMIKL